MYYTSSYYDPCTCMPRQSKSFALYLVLELMASLLREAVVVYHVYGQSLLIVKIAFLRLEGQVMI